jgi:predicted protein tyrosine phosphatase
LTPQNIAVRPQKILFVCSRNEIRSLTAERMLDGIACYQVRSAGTEAGARVRVTDGHIGWADTIFVMEKRHRERLMQKFSQAMEGKPIVCLHIPDDYDYMDEALIEVLRSRLDDYIRFPK